MTLYINKSKQKFNSNIFSSPISVNCNIEQVGEIARARSLQFVQDERRFATSCLAHNHERLVQIHHDIEHGAQIGRAGRVNKYVQRYARVNWTRERGYVVRPELELMRVYIVVIIVSLKNRFY